MTNTRVAPLKHRELHISNHELNKHYQFSSNFVKTAKYNVLDFLPKTLFLQFKRYANIYFLIIAILQCIPTISPLNPFSAIAPFVLVIALSMLREGLEDLTRHKSDKEANARKCTVLKSGSLVQQEWRHVQVGDILITKDSDFFAADLLVIGSSNPNGLCFIETSSLDGEKNLKPRTAPKETSCLYYDNNYMVGFNGKIECILPNPMLSSFEGTLTLEEGQKVILNAKQLLYRGAKQRNTSWTVGIAVYTGNDSKVMKNSESARAKQSKIETLTNKLILCILMFQIVVCLVTAVGSFVMNQTKLWKHAQYIPHDYVPALEAFIAFWSYFLLNNTMIPISLIVSLEFIKLVQAFFIERDEDIYNKEKKRGATVFTSSINEELGQVEYLFSDKTGTLTCNQMEFKIAVIGDEIYEDTPLAVTPSSSGKLSRVGMRQSQQSHQPTQEGVDIVPNSDSESETKHEPHFMNHDLKALLRDNRGDKPARVSIKSRSQKYDITKQSDLAREFFTVLSTCHECLIEKRSDGSTAYQGPSPDEVTLVDAAHSMGYSYVGGSENNRMVSIFDKEKDFQMLHSFEFNSDRKRMSVILKDSTGNIKLYTKGADTIIKSRLKHTDEQPYLKFTDQKLEEFSRKGLRTLLIAMRVLDAAEYSEFLSKYMAVASSNEKEKEIDRLADEIERDLYLIGATAVEDRLQDNVPETIYDLLQANIKVWMLTGDKLETAENIAKSCNLIQPDFQVMHCSEKTQKSIQDVLVQHRKHHDYFMENGIRKAFIIEGESLAIVLHDQILTSLFLSITKSCEAVVCCRVTPKQKADVVRLIKKHMGKITMAIGDGANDVNMIQEAHIGIGLYGQEGMRAVQASDFALPEFQGLWRLLFVHGRWSYSRISEMILYFFYKNMIFTIPQFYFAFVCTFSGQTVFDSFYITAYNLVFTSIPLLVRAALDQDVNYKEIKVNHGTVAVDTRPYVKKYFPKLYYIGQKNTLFTEKKFLGSIFQGLVHGILLFFVTFYSLIPGSLGSSGKEVDLYYFSITLYTCIIFVVSMKVAVYTKYWTILTAVSLTLLSLALYFGYMWVINSITKGTVAQTTEMLFTSCQFYFIVILNLGAIFLADKAYIYIKHRYYAGLVDYFQNLIREKAYNTEMAFKRLFKSPAPPGSASEAKNGINMENDIEKAKNDKFGDSMTPFVFNNNAHHTEEMDPQANTASPDEKIRFVQQIQQTVPSTERKERRDLNELRRNESGKNKTVVINPVRKEFKNRANTSVQK